jgi:hypothetical protein
MKLTMMSAANASAAARSKEKDERSECKRGSAQQGER